MFHFVRFKIFTVVHGVVGRSQQFGEACCLQLRLEGICWNWKGSLYIGWYEGKSKVKGPLDFTLLRNVDFYQPIHTTTWPERTLMEFHFVIHSHIDPVCLMVELTAGARSHHWIWYWTSSILLTSSHPVYPWSSIMFSSHTLGFYSSQFWREFPT
jgi:hypothetical protein